MGVCSRCHEKYMVVIAKRDAARAALAVETSNANALAHERDALRAALTGAIVNHLQETK